MSEAKHTPGPWRTDGREFVFAYKRFVAQCLTDRGIDADTALANARLIAAAPDLLALLEELIDIEGPQPGHVMWATKVRATISKAKGGA